MSNSSKRGRKNRQGQSEVVAWGPVLFPPSGETCDKCKPLDDCEVTMWHLMAILPDFVLDRGPSYRELRLLQIVKKGVEAAQNVLTEHGEGCEARGCEVCRNTRGLLWALEMAHGMLESQLPVR